MLKHVLFILFLVECAYSLTLPHEVVPGDPSSAGTCPPQESQDDTMTRINNVFTNLVQNTVSSLPQCGEGRWYSVVNFDGEMERTCPPEWTLRSEGGGVSCGRPFSSNTAGGCASVIYSTGGLIYDKVCGRATARVVGGQDGFDNGEVGIDGPYIDGVSITTNSSTRTHIWTFTADVRSENSCPCSPFVRAGFENGFEFVGDDYFCDTSLGGPLWDGEGCTNVCCSFNSPPYFTTQLPAPTSDGIEVRICGDGVNFIENIYIQLLEIYTQ